MAPKVEISDETIAKLVKEHLEKQSNESGVKRHMKRNAGGYMRLVAALGTLTAAINGYAELKERSVELSEQNALSFKALSSKVNKMAEKMAYLQGRLEGLNSERAEEAVELKIRKFDLEEKTEQVVAKVREEKRVRDEDEAEALTTASHKAKMKSKAVDKIPDQMQVQRHIEIDAFEELPEELDELMEVEEMAQEQFQGEF